MELNTNVLRNVHINMYKDTKHLTAEHSDLHNARFNRLYDDACDVGLCIWSEQLKMVTRWYLSMEKTDNEGELQETILLPCPETVRKAPVLRGWQLRIWND
jgi:hypothetical protein